MEENQAAEITMDQLVIDISDYVKVNNIGSGGFGNVFST